MEARENIEQWWNK